VNQILQFAYPLDEEVAAQDVAAIKSVVRPNYNTLSE